jgi:hypothetical protein
LLQGQIQAAEKLAPQLEQLDQQIKAKRTALAELDAEIARKNEQHGFVASALRSAEANQRRSTACLSLPWRRQRGFPRSNKENEMSHRPAGGIKSRNVVSKPVRPGVAEVVD